MCVCARVRALVVKLIWIDINEIINSELNFDNIHTIKSINLKS